SPPGFASQEELSRATYKVRPPSRSASAPRQAERVRSTQSSRSGSSTTALLPRTLGSALLPRLLRLERIADAHLEGAHPALGRVGEALSLRHRHLVRVRGDHLPNQLTRRDVLPRRHVRDHVELRLRHAGTQRVGVDPFPLDLAHSAASGSTSLNADMPPFG